MIVAIVPAELQRAVSEALDKSATFRKQYEEIAAARHVLVYVHLDEPASDPTIRARTTIRKYSSGLLLAFVNIPAGSTDDVEVLAHEFEHVLEQMEGVKLDTLSKRHPHEAVDAGRCVRDGARAARRSDGGGRSYCGGSLSRAAERTATGEHRKTQRKHD